MGNTFTIEAFRCVKLLDGSDDYRNIQIWQGESIFLALYIFWKLGRRENCIRLAWRPVKND
jgi:hypothetical protein